MEAGTVLSELAGQSKRLSAERSISMTQLSSSNSKNPQPKPRMATLETLEAKMASIEVSLSSATPRRRKGTSLNGGSISTRSSPRIEATKEIRTALQDREAVIQSLRVQLGLGKLPRPTGPPFDESERPAAEQRLSRLRGDVDNKRVAIRNLKAALDKLDITDNIDVRIRQAELEYALGREELQLLSYVEESRALHSRLEKSKPESNTLYGLLNSGFNLSLQAFQATRGRWSASIRPNCSGFWVDWALEGEGICRGDRIIEIDGKVVNGGTREELQKMIGNSGKNEVVVIRKRTVAVSQQQLQQSQSHNLRLQHRISYLEDQVKELQSANKATVSPLPIVNGKGGAHVTSISISSPPTTPPDNRPQIYQRGSYITTIVDGKAVNPPPPTSASKSPSHVTTTIIPEPNRNGHDMNSEVLKNNLKNRGFISASKISINSDSVLSQRDRREKESRRMERERYIHYMNRAADRREISNVSTNSNDLMAARCDRRRVQSAAHILTNMESNRRQDLRSVKSLDFESDNNDYTSEPVPQHHRVRPAPPKKPLRLSLQRAQSLQTVDGIMLENDKKRATKRTHKGDKSKELAYIENNIPLQTASLGRQKYI